MNTLFNWLVKWGQNPVLKYTASKQFNLCELNAKVFYLCVYSTAPRQLLLTPLFVPHKLNMPIKSICNHKFLKNMQWNLQILHATDSQFANRWIQWS